MLERLLRQLNARPPGTADTVGAPFSRRELAVAVLLLEVAQCDRGLGPEETAAIERIVRARLRVDAASTAAFIAAARTEFEAALEDWIFATQVREGFDAAERLEIVRDMWNLVYADGHLERLEEAMMKRLAGALGIGNADFEAARAQAFARQHASDVAGE